MKIKAFSIIEIIFILAIISIILVVALPKTKDIFAKANTTQIKTTIALIREGIVKEKNRLFLANSMENLHSLDDGDTNLFKKVLSTPIIEIDTPKANGWIRVSNNSYKIYLNDTESVVFNYDPNSYSFDCNFNEPLCKELTH